VAQHERQVQIAASPQDVTSRLFQSLGSLAGASPPFVQGQVVSTSIGTSMLSWGERVTAHVQAVPSGCVVTVRSASNFALFDWGKNKRNVEQVLAWIVPSAAPAPRNPS
jgi:hypothetical protein